MTRDRRESCSRFKAALVASWFRCLEAVARPATGRKRQRDAGRVVGVEQRSSRGPLGCLQG